MNIQLILQFLDISYITIILAFSTVYLFLFFFRISGLKYLYLSMFGFSVFFRAIVTHRQILLLFIPDLPLSIQALFQFGGLFAASVFFLLYLKCHYPKELSGWGIPVISLLSVPTVMLQMIRLQPWDRYAFGAWTVIAFFVFSTGIFRLLKTFRKGDRSVILRLMSLFNLSVLGFYDSIVQLGIITTLPLLPVGMTLFMLYESIISILEREGLNRKLYEANNKMKLMDATKDEFLANTSHELRTPLHGIIGLAESMMRESTGPMNDDQKATLSLIVTSGLRLSSLVNDILDLAKIRDNTLSLNIGPVCLDTITANVISMTKPLLLGKDIVINNGIDRSTPHVSGDPNRIEQIFYNLFGNAVKFTEAGSISVNAEEKDGFLAVTIHDTGAGMSIETLKEILKAGTSGSLVMDRGFGGTGLGISISKMLIEIHRGTLSIDSREGTGTTITFTLPLLTDQPEGDNCPDIEEKTEDTYLDTTLQPLIELDISKNHAAILVIDDSAINLQIMKNQLGSVGYNVIPAMSGREGIEKLDKSRPDMVILDISLSPEEGYELCRSIRQKFTQSELPILLMTEQSGHVNMMGGLHAGANDFLTRPYSLEILIARVRTHMNLSHINKVYNQFVPIEFLEFLGKKDITEVRLGDQVQRDMTVLFVDIRSFTNLSEEMTPSENFKFINSYLSRLSPYIGKHKGIIDKYIGDSIMALFPDSPENSVLSAIDMVSYMETYNHHRARCGYRPIHIGAGIHTGNLILGIIGDEFRMQGTVISDAVNLASRIQNVTKLYGANIVLSQDSFVQLENPTKYSFRFLGRVKVKGKNQSVALFEIFDADPSDIRKAKEDSKSQFEEGILLFSKREFADAAEMFRRVLEKIPTDTASRLFLDKAENFISLEKKRFLFNV